MFSATPAAVSLLNVRRGFGHRSAAATSARARATPDRAAITTGLFSDSLAKASASVTDDWAYAPAGQITTASATRNIRTRIEPLTSKRDWKDDGSTRQIRTGWKAERGAEQRPAME